MGVIDSGEQKSLDMNACTKNHVSLLNSCLDAVKQVVWSCDNIRHTLVPHSPHWCCFQPQKFKPFFHERRTNSLIWAAAFSSHTSPIDLPRAKTLFPLVLGLCHTTYLCVWGREFVCSFLQWITHWKTDRQTARAHARQVQTQQPPPVPPLIPYH